MYGTPAWLSETPASTGGGQPVPQLKFMNHVSPEADGDSVGIQIDNSEIDRRVGDDGKAEKVEDRADIFLNSLWKKNSIRYRMFAWAIISFTAFIWQAGTSGALFAEVHSPVSYTALVFLLLNLLGRSWTFMRFWKLYLEKVTDIRWQLFPLEFFFASIAYPYCYTFPDVLSEEKNTKQSQRKTKSRRHTEAKRGEINIDRPRTFKTSVILTAVWSFAWAICVGTSYTQLSSSSKGYFITTIVLIAADVYCGLPSCLYLHLLRQKWFTDSIAKASGTSFNGMMGKNLIIAEFLTGLFLFFDEISNLIWTFSLDRKTDGNIFWASISFICLFGLVRLVNLVDYVKLFFSGSLGPISTSRMYLFVLECIIVLANPLYKFSLLYHLKSRATVERPQKKWRSITTLLGVIFEDIPEFVLAVYQMSRSGSSSWMGILSVGCSAVMFYMEGMQSALRLLKGRKYVDRHETQSQEFWNHLSHKTMFRADLAIRYDINQDKIIYYEAQFDLKNLYGRKEGLDFFIGWTETFPPPRYEVQEDKREVQEDDGEVQEDDIEVQEDDREVQEDDSEVQEDDSEVQEDERALDFVLRPSTEIVTGDEDEFITLGVCLNFPQKTITCYQVFSDEKKEKLGKTKQVNVRSDLCLYPVCGLGSTKGVCWVLDEYYDENHFKDDDPQEIKESMSVLTACGFAFGSFVHIDYQWWLRGQWCPLPHVLRKGVQVSLANFSDKVLSGYEDNPEAFPTIYRICMLFFSLELINYILEFMATTWWAVWWDAHNMKNASYISAVFFAFLLLTLRGCGSLLLTCIRFINSLAVPFFSFFSSFILSMMFFLAFSEFRELTLLNRLLWAAVIVRIFITVFWICLSVIQARYEDNYSKLDKSAEGGKNCIENHQLEPQTINEDKTCDKCKGSVQLGEQSMTCGSGCFIICKTCSS